jgi:hypothetical protein
MADLIDRLTGLSESMTPPRPQITIHEFEAHFGLLGTGKWTGTEAQIGLDLQGDELVQAQKVLTVMAGKNATQKITYGIVVQSVAKALAHAPRIVNGVPEPVTNVYFSWNGDQLVVNKARVATDLEITL